MATLIQIRKAFTVYPKWSGVEANEKLALEACGERASVRIDNVIDELGRAGKLAVSSDYTRAYQEFFAVHPEYAHQANMSVLDSVLIHFCEPITFQNLEELLLPGNPRNVLDQLSITAAAQQARDDAQRSKELVEHQAQETNRMIVEITGYMLDERSRVKFEYQREYKGKVAGLRSLPFADLQKRHETVMAARAQRKAPVVRAEESEFQLDKYRPTKNQQHFSALEQPRDPNASEVQPDVVAVNLINPSTKQPFQSRKELKKYFDKLPPSETRDFFYHPGYEPRRPKSGIQELVKKILGVK